MTFNIYRDGRTFTLTHGNTLEPGFVDEAAAADAAIRFSQHRDALYTLNYWRP